MDVFQDLKLAKLESKIENECAMTEHETATSQQLHGLAKQSTQALEALQKELLLTSDKVEELKTFVEVWMVIFFWVLTWIKVFLIESKIYRIKQGIGGFAVPEQGL